MVRRILGTIAGIVVAMVTIFVIEMIGHTLYPPAAGLDMRTPGGVTAYLAAVPTSAMVFPVAGWLLGALLGGWAATRLSGWTGAAWVVAGLVALGGIYNATQIPAPLWMRLSTVLAPALGGLLAHRLGMRRG
jgi:hypothetical protein